MDREADKMLSVIGILPLCDTTKRQGKLANGQPALIVSL